MSVLTTDDVEWLKSAIGRAVVTPARSPIEHAELILAAIRAAGFDVCRANEVIVKVRLDTAEAAAELDALAEKMRSVKSAGDIAV